MKDFCTFCSLSLKYSIPLLSPISHLFSISLYLLKCPFSREIFMTALLQKNCIVENFKHIQIIWESNLAKHCWRGRISYALWDSSGWTKNQTDMKQINRKKSNLTAYLCEIRRDKKFQKQWGNLTLIWANGRGSIQRYKKEKKAISKKLKGDVWETKVALLCR